MGVDNGFVRKSGAWYTYEGGQLGQGKENARKFLKDNPDIANEIEKKIKEKLGIGPKLDADAKAADGVESPAKAIPAPVSPTDKADKPAARAARGRASTGASTAGAAE
jgi:recombination protein RecA